MTWLSSLFQDSFPFALDQSSNDESFFGSPVLYFCEIYFAHNSDHANVHVEDTVHLFGGEVAFLLGAQSNFNHNGSRFKVFGCGGQLVPGCYLSNRVG